MAVEMVAVDGVPQLAHQGIIGFHRLTAGMEVDAAELDIERLAVGGDFRGQTGPGGGHGGLRQHQHPPPAAKREQIGQNPVVRSEGPAGKNDPVLENDGYFKIMAGHWRAAMLSRFGAPRHCLFANSAIP
jgi:hypothetical protein